MQSTFLRARLLRVLLFKLAGLCVLWYLFFSQAHRPAVDAASLGRQLAVAPAAGVTHVAAARAAASAGHGSAGHD